MLPKYLRSNGIHKNMKINWCRRRMVRIIWMPRMRASDTYGTDLVSWRVFERNNRGRFHNETNCFSVKLQCARVDCKAPATLHVNLKDGEAEKDCLRLLKANFFDGLLPCGHQIMPIPDRYYVDPHRVMSLW